MSNSDEAIMHQLTLDGALAEIRDLKEIVSLCKDRLKHSSDCAWAQSYRNKSSYAYCDCGQDDLRKRIIGKLK